MAETMTALEALQRYAEAAPDNEIAKWWSGMDSIQRNGWVRLMEEPANGDTTPEWSLVRRLETLSIVAAVRALSAREEQVRRTALVEGARWGLQEARARCTKASLSLRNGGAINAVRTVAGDITSVNPTAILGREKGAEKP